MTRGASSLQAFRRLLKEAQAGGAAKVDTMLAFAMRTFIVPTGENGELYTLVDEAGEHALAVFSGPDELDRAASLLGWTAGDGFVPHRELTGNQAMGSVVKHGLARLVIDVMGSHALEIDRDELEPLLGPQVGDDEGAGAVGERVSSSLLERVKSPSETPPSGMYRSDPPPPRTPSTPPLATGFALGPLGLRPGAPLLHTLSTVLQRYPEVEWAAFCHIQTESYAGAAVAVRIDPTFRTRLRQIAGGLRDGAAELGLPIEVVLLDDPELVRQVREEQQIFYPWRVEQNGRPAG